MGDPEFLGWVETSGEGIGGGWVPRKDALEPTIWCLKLPKKLWARLIKPANPGRDFDINDMKMSGKLLAWLVLEGIVGTQNLRYKHIGFFRNNTAAVSWTQRGAAKSL